MTTIRKTKKGTSKGAEVKVAWLYAVYRALVDAKSIWLLRRASISAVKTELVP